MKNFLFNQYCIFITNGSPRKSMCYFSWNQSVVKIAFALYPKSMLLRYCFSNTNALLMDNASGRKRALDMINGLDGGSVGFSWDSLSFHISLQRETVWKNGGHGDKGPGCKPQRNGDLWMWAALLCYFRYNYTTAALGSWYYGNLKELQRGNVVVVVVMGVRVCGRNGERDTTKLVVSWRKKPQEWGER